MDNIILSGMLKDFVTRHSLEDDPPDRQFEKFANYCLLKTDHYDSFDFDRVSTDDCVGVDGVAVSIGGVIVDELEDAETFTHTQFDVRFIFAQSKTASKFDLGKILKTYLGVVKCSDYVRMIQKEDGDRNKGLFFENVRDFLGTRNTVNEGIARTIHNPPRQRSISVTDGM